MAINFQVPDQPQQVQSGPRITVIGVGGAGGNAVNNMIQASLEGVEFVVANTDAQALAQSKSDHRIQLGAQLTAGLGAGSKPEIGRDAALESIDDIMAQINGSNMVFIAAGMGGGTGTGAAPVIAHAAREAGILTVGVVTKPFMFEGVNRMRLADAGIEEIQKYVDTLIVIPNQNLFRVATENTTFAQAFQMADEVLHSGVRGVTDLMVRPGMINLDFSDIKTVMMEMGKAMMGTGEAAGERRAIEAAEAAISNQLLDDSSMKGAKAALINITGGMDIGLFEIDEAVDRILKEVDPNANIIFGTTLDETMEGTMRVSVVSTGIETQAIEQGLTPELKVVAEKPPVQAPVKEEPRQETTWAAQQAQPQKTQSVTNSFLSMQGRATAEAQALPAQQPTMMADPVDPRQNDVQGAMDVVENVSRRIQKSLAENDPLARPQAPKAAAQKPFMPPKPAEAIIEDEPVEAVNPFEKPAPHKSAEKTRSLFERVTDRVTGRDAQSEPVAQQPTLMATTPEDRPQLSSNAEDDLLDIPAFLRRQAN